MALFVRRLQQEDAQNQTRVRRDSKYEMHTIVHSDEVRNSGVPKSLGDILSSEDLRYKFRQFLKEKHASESLMFYESIELYEKIQDVKWRKRAGEGLLSKFVLEESELEVNISSHCRVKLVRNTKWEQNTFQDAKGEVYDLLKTNFFASFIAKEFLKG